MSASGPASAWRGAAALRPGWLLYAGVVGTASPHAHHTVQVLAARGGEFELADGHGGRVACRAAAIPADATHAVLRGSPDAVLLHIDRDSATGRALNACARDAASWANAARSLPIPAAAGLAGAEALAAALPRVPAGPPAARHPALARALRAVAVRLDRSAPVRLGDVAREAGLSEGRLAHLFRDELGLPFRPYVLWLRIQRATELVAAGESLTLAAHGAGLADSAHLSRVCRRMFGIAPSEFTRGIRWAVGDAPRYGGPIR
ncbi:MULTISPECIES: helix-turn-helix transcriptional regulator [Actinomadura]|uniref:Helix-turn-helix transcriptional regulator n=1 Tax=Actinomadura yumaensis TaxID=111807 RepID=A0ABW2CJM3_9ACTN|nr:helix-turn-helix transcriptional regulator [Actinomadura sp. J1-007]MWK38590.1 helix-turn-helix domain-containing protein [Actinomadura sp. J1-007]